MSPPTAERASTAAVRLYVSRQSWVRRRVERVELRDDRVMRRFVSIDFRPPVGLPVDDDGAVYLPLGVMKKQPLTGFDVQDAQGGTVSLLAADENAAYVTDGMLEWLVAISGHEVPPAVVDAVEAVVFHNLRDGDPAKKYSDAETTVEAWLGTSAAAGPRRDEIEAWMKLLSIFSEGFLMIVRLNDDALRRGIIKFSYDETFDVGGGARRYTLGWRPALLEIELVGFGDAGSYHVEATLPRGLGATDAEAALEPETGAQVVFPWEDEDQAHVHFHLGRQPEGRGLLRLRVVPRPRSFLTLASGATGLTAAAAVGGWMFLEELTRSATTDVAALLVGLTALGVSMLLWNSDHPLVTKVQKGTRFMAWLSAATTVVLAGTLLIGRDPEALASWWRTGAAITTGAWLTVMLGGRRSPYLWGK